MNKINEAEYISASASDSEADQLVSPITVTVKEKH